MSNVLQVFSTCVTARICAKVFAIGECKDRITLNQVCLQISIYSHHSKQDQQFEVSLKASNYASTGYFDTATSQNSDEFLGATPPKWHLPSTRTTAYLPMVLEPQSLASLLPIHKLYVKCSENFAVIPGPSAMALLRSTYKIF
jgi:hypothetical protein